ncbi:hypothetical protein QQS21_005302 [Conoideocrella luteorostrata]|uniref:Ysc84 actin-binding domain-containing protein n=1 Tax=Conoideocrella luteorostrata TaxID=1105319 RepID=A0AAJ0FZ92_9HYPO|nr:hypothetical protein QQS21_005302 [Conoideocrella luteorostrata]
MQKVKSALPSWAATKTQSKKGFDKAWGLLDKLGAPVNRWTNKIGSEAFWPTTLDKESYKAARILRSFCSVYSYFPFPPFLNNDIFYVALAAISTNYVPVEDGFYTEKEDEEKEHEHRADQSGPKNAPKVLKKIPQKVIENAVGLAIFTTMRTGLWISGAGGSGVLVARQEDGSWSPPSGIMLHTAGLGFLVGVDIYDCVVVINNRKALEAFTKIRATLGGEISAVAGPVGVGGVLENDGKWKQANRPVFTYLKSRGFYAGVQVDGTVVIERTDENARFYGERIGVSDILAGKARHPPPEIKVLMETLKAAEGKNDVDSALMEELDGQLAPGDLTVEDSDGKMFGVPEPDDPDPYGVHALEKEGLDILEAGSRQRPSSLQFEYSPSPSSPTYSRFHRRSLGAAGTTNRAGYTSRSSRRQTMNSHYTTSDAGTQTGDDDAFVQRVRSRSDGFIDQNLQHRDQSHESDQFHDVDTGEDDGFVNEYVQGNPWKSNDEVTSRDSGVAMENEIKAGQEKTGQAADTKLRGSSPGRRSLVPPMLPPR